MEKIKAVILAAGQGTRMKSKLPKVAHKIIDKSMIEYVIRAARGAGAEDVCVVIGHEAEKVKEIVGDNVTYVYQTEQKGTGHAVMQAKDFIGTEGKVLVLFGDTPLITGKTLNKLVDKHNEGNNSATVLSTVVKDSTGYGLIIRDSQGGFIKSVEYKDANETERLSKEINSGMFIFEAETLYNTLGKLTNNNAQNEYYLPDCLDIIKKNGMKVDCVATENYEEILGVNSRVQLSEVTKIMQKRINEFWMNEGVTMLNPELTFVGIDVTMGRDVIIYPNVYLFNQIIIGDNTIVGGNSEIDNSIIGENVIIGQSVIIESEIENNSKIGPYQVIIDNKVLRK